MMLRRHLRLKPVVQRSSRIRWTTRGFCSAKPDSTPKPTPPDESDGSAPPLAAVATAGIGIAAMLMIATGGRKQDSAREDTEPISNEWQTV